MKSELEQIDLKDIAYIRILEYAASKAVGYRFRDNNDGFTFSDIYSDEKIKQINVEWLKNTLKSICNIYRDGEGLLDKDKEEIDITENNIKLVIKNEEFMKFVNIVNHEATIKKLKYAIIGLGVTTVGLAITISSLWLKN